MATLTAYKGLQVVSPDPTGSGGLAIQDDFKALVDWSPKSAWAQSADPGVNDDQSDDYYPGSLWLRTDTTPPKLFVCQSNAGWPRLLRNRGLRETFLENQARYLRHLHSFARVTMSSNESV